MNHRPTTVTAGKSHICGTCERDIEKGEQCRAHRSGGVQYWDCMRCAFPPERFTHKGLSLIKRGEFWIGYGGERIRPNQARLYLRGVVRWLHGQQTVNT